MRALLCVPLVALVAGCGGGDGGGGDNGGGGGGATAVQLELGSNGVSQRSVTVASGGQVTFINNDSVAHEMSSNPHPTHTDCPELNGPVLQPGERFTATMTSSGRTCGFHDHMNPNDSRFSGTIQVMGGTNPSGNGGGGGGDNGGGGGY